MALVKTDPEMQQVSSDATTRDFNNSTNVGGTVESALAVPNSGAGADMDSIPVVMEEIKIEFSDRQRQDTDCLEAQKSTEENEENSCALHASETNATHYQLKVKMEPTIDASENDHTEDLVDNGTAMECKNSDCTPATSGTLYCTAEMVSRSSRIKMEPGINGISRKETITVSNTDGDGSVTDNDTKTSGNAENEEEPENTDVQLSSNGQMSSWTRIASGEVSNVVRTLFTRELGYPFFSRSEDSNCNAILETKITRQLVSNRAAEFTEAKAKPCRVCKLSNGRTKKKQIKVRNNLSNWAQLEVSSPENTQVVVADSGLWKRQKEGRGRAADSKFAEEFYSVEPEPHMGFVLTKRESFKGKVKSAAIIDIRTPTIGANSIYLLTLHEPCHLRAFDTVKRKTASHLTLDLGLTVGLKAYTDFDACDNIAKIFVMGTGPTRGYVKVILILDFPPSWTKVGIIYVNNMEFSLTINDGLCVMKQIKNVLKLTTWPMLYSKVQPLEQPTGKIPDTSRSLNVVFEGQLQEMPDLINTIKLYDNSFGILFQGIPLVYGATEYGVKFFYPVGFAGETEPEFAYQFQLTTRSQQDIDVFSFPDSTPRVLITSHVNKVYEVVEFRTKLDENEKKVSFLKTMPFEQWNELKKKDAAIAAARKTPAAGRPQRSCSKRNTELPCDKTSILGIQYNGMLDLLAVLMVDDEHFLVILYKSHSLEVFKILPPVLAWPSPPDSGEPNPKRECIEGVDLAFESHFIFVSFEYRGISKSKRDFFCLRLMTEDPTEVEKLK